jgi:hypothetical protein
MHTIPTGNCVSIHIYKELERKHYPSQMDYRASDNFFEKEKK